MKKTLMMALVLASVGIAQENVLKLKKAGKLVELPGTCRSNEFFYCTDCATPLKFCKSSGIWEDAQSLPSGSNGDVQMKSGTAFAVAPINCTASGCSISAPLVDSRTAVRLNTYWNFASTGLTGWTQQNGSGWEISGGKLHHITGNSNKISTPITVTQGAAYQLRIVVTSTTGTASAVNLGEDCNSTCVDIAGSGTTLYTLAASWDSGAAVLEIEPGDTDSDVVIDSIQLLDLSPPVYGATTSNLGLGANTYGSLDATASGNIALGPGTLVNLTSGSNNIAIGINAGRALTTVQSTVAVGAEALSAATGYSNTGVGRNALSGVTTGNSNAALGSFATVDSGAATNRTVIGAEATGKFDNSVTLGRTEDVVNIPKTTYSTLPTCNGTTEGSVKPLTDGSTATWGATLAGGGANRVLAYCNGTNWTVMAK